MLKLNPVLCFLHLQLCCFNLSVPNANNLPQHHSISEAFVQACSSDSKVAILGACHPMYQLVESVRHVRLDLSPEFIFPSLLLFVGHEEYILVVVVVLRRKETIDKPSQSMGGAVRTDVPGVQPNLLLHGPVNRIELGASQA